MGVVEEMLAPWRNAGVRLNPGASAEDLQRLEDALGAPLPSDLRAYFAIADGMREGEIDDDLGHSGRSRRSSANTSNVRAATHVELTATWRLPTSWSIPGICGCGFETGDSFQCLSRVALRSTHHWPP
jgi:hypothetical protein